MGQHEPHPTQRTGLLRVLVPGNAGSEQMNCAPAGVPSCISAPLPDKTLAFKQLCKTPDRRATCSMQSIAAHFNPPPAGLQSSTEATCRSFLSGLESPRMLATLRGPVQQPQWGCTSSSRWALRSQTASEVLTCLLEPLGISESCVPRLGALQGTSATALPCLKQLAGGQVRAQGHICSGSSRLIAMPCLAPVVPCLVPAAGSSVLLWLPAAADRDAAPPLPAGSSALAWTIGPLLWYVSTTPGK